MNDEFTWEVSTYTYRQALLHCDQIRKNEGIHLVTSNV